MTNQKKECYECSKVLELLIKQSNKLTEQNNKITEQNTQVLQVLGQVIQINNEQNAQINHLLEHLEDGEEVVNTNRSLDGG